MKNSKVLFLLLIISVAINFYQRYLLQLQQNQSFDHDTLALTQSGVKKSNVLQQKWLKVSSDFFKVKLGLSDQQIMSFHGLKASREQELNTYIIPKLNAHQLKHAGSPYLYSMQDSVFIGRLNEKYMTRLKKLIGKKNFQLYENYKNSFNRKLISSHHNSNIIDF